MQNNILFFQSTSIGGVSNTPGLFELLLTHLDGLHLSIFQQQQIIVPSPAIASWLKDQIALKHGICANLDCVVLPGPVLDNIYAANNPAAILFNFNKAKYIIYDYLCNNHLDNADELNNYIYVNDKLDKLRVYQLAAQLQKIFHEYIYLRTEDLLNLDKSAIKPWQKEIIKHLMIQIGEEKTFLDVYKYFMHTSLETIQLPDNLIIFGLTSIYPSQLRLLSRLSNKLTLYWYYQTPSYQYYGDLLSDNAKRKLEQKLLKQPDLSLDDLYLLDGNPLLANLGQQSREFTELLIANDIDPYMFEQNSDPQTATLLQQIQEDIRTIKYRIHPDYRFGSDLDIYVEPLDISDLLVDDQIYDLPDQTSSIKINICHNRMREVQVMFNELIYILNNNPEAVLSEVLITAPDIDDYAPYIAAVFDNEMVNGQKLLYNITGNRKYKNYKILETLKILLNTPYLLTANYFIEILIQAEIQDNLGISSADVELIKKWLYDNNTNFGYNENDYAGFGYIDYQIHGFRQFLNNLVLGACISENIWQGRIPLYTDINHADSKYIPYDNLDNNQVSLCNKLILLVDLLEELRSKFYIDINSYTEMTIAEVRAILLKLGDCCLHDQQSINNFEHFLGELLTIPADTLLTLPILNLIVDEYIDNFSSRFMFNGSITCASIRYMRNIPFKYTYILGLNFGEYPNSYTPNQLSVLAHDWSLADRNYNVEDKQAFLDILLACKKQLYFSYVGRRETDNSAIKPSPLLSLFMNTLGSSFTDFSISYTSAENKDIGGRDYDFKNLVVQQSLHPFYNNKQPNFSSLWFELANLQDDFCDRAWDFGLISPPTTDLSEYYVTKVDHIIKAFLYTNTNLYKVLGINRFNHEVELSDTENINLADRNLAIQMEKYLNRYFQLSKDGSRADTEATARVDSKLLNVTLTQLEDYLITSGILAYDHIGHMQFKYYYELYSKYIGLRGKTNARITFSYMITPDIILTLEDEIYLDGSTVVVTDSFANLFTDVLVAKVDDLPYALKIKGLFIYLLCFGGAVVTVGEAVQTVEKVFIRQITINGESQDFNLHIDGAEVILNRVLRYYVRSLSNPVLIHKGAIQEYAKLVKSNKPQNLCVDGARAKYLADFENHDLDKIRDDLIFSSIADNYFEFIHNINGVNDIVKIGEILASI